MTGQARPDAAHDVTAMLVAQHEEIRLLFGRVAAAEGKQRADLFFRLRRLLAVHETAEEMIVHPRARWRLGDGDPVVNPRLKEEMIAKRMLAELGKLPIDSADFAAGFERLRERVLAHAEAEERIEFPRMREAFGGGQLRRMRVAARMVEAVAPTRAHPGVVFAAENGLAGGFASVVDRVRDLFSRHPNHADTGTDADGHPPTPDGGVRADGGLRAEGAVSEAKGPDWETPGRQTNGPDWHAPG
jgi:hemerythrin superfamily protein